MPVITYADNVSVKPEEFEASGLFLGWLSRFGKEWDVQRVHVDLALAWNGDVRMAFISVEGINADGRWGKATIFLRGGTVDILAIITAPDGSKYVVFVKQPRWPAGEIVTSNPSGMTDGQPSEVAALRELNEEVGSDLSWNGPIWINLDVTASSAPFLVSPGGSDEAVEFCVVYATATAEQMRSLDGRVTGLASENEVLGVILVRYEEALAFLALGGARPDLKAAFSIMAHERMLASDGLS